MRFLSCDGLGASPVELLAASLGSFRKLPEWHGNDGREVIYTYQGRNAISLFCRLAGLRPGDEVLAPAYNCGAEIDPFVKAGGRVVLYDVDPHLGFDVDDVVRAITRSTRVVYVTHFFGVAQQVDRLADICRQRGVLLVEDCAQGLFSGGKTSGLGRTGDAAIFSFVKSLPAPDRGALLVAPGLGVGEYSLVAPPLAVSLRWCLPLVKKWLANSPVARRARAARRRSGGRSAFDSAPGQFYPPMLQSNCFIPERALWTMSRFSRGILQAADIPAIVRTRRRNFEHLLGPLAYVAGLSPVITSLPPEACPLAFPFVVSDRAFWSTQLESRGILIQGWPGYYPGFDWGQYPQACRFKDKLLTLPVHQGLGLEHMEYIVACVREVAVRAKAERRC